MKKMFPFLVLLSGVSLLTCPAHAQFARSDPWADIRQFGAHARYSSTSATTTFGRPTVILASAQSFKNGEYVTVYNAGPTDCTNAMGTVALTPSLNAGSVLPRARRQSHSGPR